MRKLLFLPFILLSLIACEKVIDVDLNTADPKTVVDASLCAQDSVHWIFISQSGRFTDAQGLARVSGAAITLTDQNGVEGTFTELDSSIYFLTNYPLIDGNIYDLVVSNGDDVITASSVLNPAIPIDSIFFEEKQFGGGGPQGRTKYTVRILFQDPPGIANYYRQVMSVNDTLDRAFRVVNDDLTDGNQRNLRYQGRSVKIGDEIDMELWTIDQPGYNYFSTMQDISSNGGFASATPYNPISNLSGGLGNFTVYNRTKISGMVTP